MKRPDNLVFSADEMPSVWVMLILAMQYVATISIFFILSALIAEQAQVSVLAKSSVVSITMFASAIGVILQANKRFGSGQILPLSSSPALFPPAFYAVQIGGLPLVFGMTIFAGICQMIISPLLTRISFLFPPMISGLIIFIIGIQLGTWGVKDIFATCLAHGNYTLTANFLISLLVLILLAIFTLTTEGYLSYFALIISLAVGYILIYIFGQVDPQIQYNIQHSTWFFIPHFSIGQYSFNKGVAVTFMIAAIVCSIKVVGALTALQKLQDSSWDKPDMKNIARGNCIDALTSMLSGMLGGTGLNASSSSMALTLSNRIASRYTAYFVAIIILTLAFSQKIALLLVYMPTALTGAALVFLGATLIHAGLGIFIPYLRQLKNALIIGISFILGFSYGLYPSFYASLPSVVNYFTGSSLAVSTITAIFLNLILNLVNTILKKS